MPTARGHWWPKQRPSSPEPDGRDAIRIYRVCRSVTSKPRSILVGREPKSVCQQASCPTGPLTVLSSEITSRLDCVCVARRGSRLWVNAVKSYGADTVDGRHVEHSDQVLVGAPTSPVWYARTTAWTRSRSPSLRSIRATWVLTVASLSTSSAASSALLRPFASS